MVGEQTKRPHYVLVVPAIRTISSCPAREMSQLPSRLHGQGQRATNYVGVKGAAPSLNSINGATPSLNIFPVLHI